MYNTPCSPVFCVTQRPATSAFTPMAFRSSPPRTEVPSAPAWAAIRWACIGYPRNPVTHNWWNSASSYVDAVGCGGACCSWDTCNRPGHDCQRGDPSCEAFYWMEVGLYQTTPRFPMGPCNQDGTPAWPRDCTLHCRDNPRGIHCHRWCCRPFRPWVSVCGNDPTPYLSSMARYATQRPGKRPWMKPPSTRPSVFLSSVYVSQADETTAKGTHAGRRRHHCVRS